MIFKKAVFLSCFFLNFITLPPVNLSRNCDFSILETPKNYTKIIRKSVCVSKRNENMFVTSHLCCLKLSFAFLFNLHYFNCMLCNIHCAIALNYHKLLFIFQHIFYLVSCSLHIFLTITSRCTLFTKKSHRKSHEYLKKKYI